MANIFGTNGADSLSGTDLADRIYARSGNDTIYAGDGNDLLIGGSGNDALYGGKGLDTALFTGKSTDYRVVHLGNGNYEVLSLVQPVFTGAREAAIGVSGAHAVGDAIDSAGLYGNDHLFEIEKLRFDDGTFDIAALADTIGTLIHPANDGEYQFFDSNLFADSPTATAGDDFLSGGPGNDIIATGSGSDTVFAGAGDDIIAGNIGGLHYNPDGATIIDPDGNDGDGFNVVGGDTLYGGDGNDSFYAGYGTKVDGGAGVDTVHLDLSLHWEPWVAHTILTSFNTLGLIRDLRTAANGAVSLSIDGIGNPFISIENVERFDIVFGGGDDRIIGGLRDDVLNGAKGDDWLSGDTGNDTLIGGDGADTLLGDTGNDTLQGDGGADRLSGGKGNDVLLGSDGRDILNGGAGDDRLIGGSSADQLTGSTGADTFVLANLPVSSAGRDTVTDFVHGVDKIEISMSGFGGSEVFGSSVLTLGSTAGSSSEHLLYDAATGLLRFDADGSGAGSAIDIALLANKPALDASDIVLVF